MSMIANFEAMLASGRDTALLRFSLGNAYLQAGEAAKAVPHLQAAVTLDPDYSAAWKLLGKACASLGQMGDARAAYETGISVAERKGDKQSAKEMTVFLKRLGPAVADR
jgi:predicted Zn-dependent protease